MSAWPDRPLTVLVAALGGEGGGVLSNWLVAAAAGQGFPVQSTSIPGVAQRTGATTYYLELYPVALADLGGREPVFALTPSPGNVDLMVASELLEAGRALQQGLITPERTTLIASTHRIYLIDEKSAMADGRFEGGRILRAAEKLARRAILSDLGRVAEEAGSFINAVLLGAIAGSGVLPLSRESFEAAIRAGGIAVEANLTGFAAGFAIAKGGAEVPAGEGAAARPLPRTGLSLEERVRNTYPEAVREVAILGVARLVDYQDERYARLYLEHLDSVLALDRAAGGEPAGFPLTKECARALALWMAYEDVIRVADLKIRASRFERVRAEVGAKADEPVIVTEYLKPGLDEFTSVMPRPLAALARWLARVTGSEERLNVGMYVRTTSLSGFVPLWLLAKLGRWRRRMSRYAAEQALIARWLAAIDRAARIDYRLALEIVECARLVKGYGDTHRRGVGNFRRLLDTVVSPILSRGGAEDAAETVARARKAALADPEGQALAEVLARIAEEGAAVAEAPLAAAGE